MNEAETCRKLVRPRLEGAGWDASRQHYYSEQFAFTDGRIVTPSGQPVRLKRKIADFLLHYTRDLTLGVVEAKSKDLPAGNGLQQAKEYAEILGLMFAYATNGKEIIEYDYFSSIEREVEGFPSPAELWERYQSGRKLGPNASAAMLLPYYNQPGRIDTGSSITKFAEEPAKLMMEVLELDAQEDDGTSPVDDDRHKTGGDTGRDDPGSRKYRVDGGLASTTKRLRPPSGLTEVASCRDPHLRIGSWATVLVRKNIYTLWKPK